MTAETMIMSRLHTRQSWLETGLLPTAVNSSVKTKCLKNTSDLSHLADSNNHVCWLLSYACISFQAREHRWAQESSARDIGPVATTQVTNW